MNNTFATLLALALLLLFPEQGIAHRVNIFAFVDGEAVQIECSFSKSQRVRHGRLIMTDAQDGTVLEEAITDEQGRYRYHPDQAFLMTGHGLKISLNAGEGHQSSWMMTPDELQVLAVSGGQKKLASQPNLLVSQAKSSQPAAAGQHGKEDLTMEQKIENMLKNELAPMRQMLVQIYASQQEHGPDIKDIIGGIGWIIGLFGMAAFFKNNKG
ncbi:MAG: hypothetical protein J6I40_02790 [Mailhella sp.]|nr:hypothetical protein [Mailhella sp.]